MEVETDLIIIGGGPTGLLSALLARKLGLSVYIIDAKEGPLKLGRADALNARTQQYLEVTKTLEPLLNEGLKCDTSSTFAAGDFVTRQNHWWTSLSNTYHRNFLMIGQPRVESVLSAQLDSPAHYNVEATSIKEDDSNVIVETSENVSIKGRYAVAADGAKSFVRNALNIPFLGAQPEMIWAVLDTFLETDFPSCPEIITFQSKGQARVSWIPRERDMARFYVLLDGEITQEKAEQSIREHMAPYTVHFKATEWFSTFEVKERVASTFISKSGKGRILLGGDAAHIHSVNGGQGLNTGLADAFALAWRVAYVAKGYAGQELLHTYDIERREVAAGVIDVAAKLVRSTIKTAQEYVSIIEKNAGNITGMGVFYPPSKGNDLVRPSRFGAFVAGERCPDLDLLPVLPAPSTCSGCGSEQQIMAAHGEYRRLYSQVSYGRFIVLLLGNQHDQCKVSSQLEKRAATVEFWNAVAKTEDMLNVREPEAYGKSVIAQSSVRYFQVNWLKEEEEDSVAVVIRPDMYIGYAGRDWEEYLSTILR